MNKRGHIPTIMTFIVALILVSTAWFSFLNKSSSVDENSKELFELTNELRLSEEYIQGVFYGSIEQAIKSADKNNFETSFNNEFFRIVNERDLRLEYGGNFFGKVRNREYQVIKQGNQYLVTVEGIRVSSTAGVNEIIKEVNLTASFDEAEILS